MTTQTGEAEAVNELEAALDNDRAFESWHRRMLPRVYSYLLSRCAGDVTLAEELTQQTFIAAIDRRSRFDGRSDAITWLCGIARHKLADHFRSREREERRDAQMLLASLTDREREIMTLLAEGLRNDEIATRLFISPQTVQTHVRNILSKLRVHSKLEAVSFAVRHGAIAI